MAYSKPYDKNYRSQKRIQGEDVLGNKIHVLPSSIRNYAGRKVRNGGGSGGDSSYQSASSHLSSNGRSQTNTSQNRNSHNKLQQQELNQSGVASNQDRPLRGHNNISLMDVSYNNSSSSGGVSRRRPRTPQDMLFNSLSLSGRVHKISGGSSENSDDGKTYGGGSQLDKSNNTPVELIISNLDQSIAVKDLRRLLTNLIKDYAMILSLNVSIQTDGTPIAIVRVASQQEAQYTISQLHRHKLGYKRIIISYVQASSADPAQLRAMVISLLQEVPDQSMPLFKFIDLLEVRYHCTVSVSEINKLKDICCVSEESGSRIIALTHDVKSTSPSNNDLGKNLVPYCTIHCSNAIQKQGWCELSIIQTPNVMMSLKLFATKLKGLLTLHSGSMPLLSFQTCYEKEYQESLPVNNNGVPLEHFITCVDNVSIKCSGPNKNIKIITVDSKVSGTDLDEESVFKTIPPSLAQNISLLCRELIDLLKTADKCQILLSKFIPAYHHHFGRQCHVADYGYTKLLDLFESIPHVIQIMGDGTRRIITLSHHAQIRRFTSDILRVLKVQPLKQINIVDYPSAYEKVLNKPFNVVEYGLCSFEDLLAKVPTSFIVVIKNDDDDDDDNNVMIAIPKRGQTVDEIALTKQFKIEVIDMLKHSPYCTMLFNKFVPAYHHHFGTQCKVADYGFSKLIELFEAIPDIIKIQELADGERAITLTLPQAIKVLGSQIMAIIKNSKSSSIIFDELPSIYLRECGYPLKPQVYDCNSVMELIEMLSDYVQVSQGSTDGSLMLVSVDTDLIPIIKIRTWAILLKPPYYKDFIVFKYEYESRYNHILTLNHLQQLRNIVSLSFVDDMNYIALTDLYVLAAKLYNLLYINGGSILINDLEELYLQYYGKILNITQYEGMESIRDVFKQFDFLFYQHDGCGKRNLLSLNRNLIEYQIPIPLPLNFPINGNRNNNGKYIQWPSLPIVNELNANYTYNNSDNIIGKGRKKISPPKPDTPPTPGAVCWNNWNNNTPTTTNNNDFNLSLKLPIIENPPFLGDPKCLISPARSLFTTNSPWLKYRITPPAPMDLPLPDKLMMIKGHISDDSSDSGVNSKLDNSPSDNETETASNCGAKMDICNM